MIGRLRGWMRNNPGGRDTLIAGLWLLFGMVLWQLGGIRLWQSLAVIDAPSWVFLILLVGIAAVLTKRSKFPLRALCAGSAIATVDLLCGGSLGVLLALSDLIFAAVRYSSDRALNVAIRVILGGGLLFIAALFIMGPEDPMVLVMAFQLVLLVAVSGIWGWNVRSEGERTRILLDEKHAAETTVLRDRIAHDLHDLVANQIAVAGLHIEAARLQTAGLCEGNVVDHCSDAFPDTAPLEASLARAKVGTDEAHLQLRRLITVLTSTNPLEEFEPVEIHSALAKIEGLLPMGREMRWDPGSRDLVIRALASASAAEQSVVVRVFEELVMNAAKHGDGDVDVTASLEPGAHDGVSRTLRISLANEHSLSGLGGRQSTGFGLRGATMLMNSIGGELTTERTDAKCSHADRSSAQRSSAAVSRSENGCPESPRSGRWTSRFSLGTSGVPSEPSDTSPQQVSRTALPDPASAGSANRSNVDPEPDSQHDLQGDPHRFFTRRRNS